MSEQEHLQHLRELQAPLKSFRLFAIEHFIREGQSREIAAALDAALMNETDEECRILLGHAISEVRRRLAASLEPPARGMEEVGGAEFPARFAAADSADRLTLLRQLRKADLSALAEFAVGAFQRETHPLVARDLIRCFTPAWPQEARSILGRALASEWQTVRFAALEALIAIAPRDLLAYLPGLLRHADPRVRSMAIRALAAIDAPEAARHLEAQLLGGEREGRWSALRECARLPFELTRSVLFAYLETEKDQELLEAAGAIILANPEVETPFRLADLLSRRSDLGAWLGPVLQNSIAVLRDSGQLTEDSDSYRTRVQQYVDRLAARRLVHRAVSALASGDSTQQAEGGTLLRQHLNRPVVRQLLEETVRQELPALLQQQLSEILQPESMSPAAPELDQWPSSAPESEQLRWLATRQAEQVQQWRPAVEKLVTDSSIRSTLKIGALRALTRCRTSGSASAVFPLLNHADDGVAAAALEYLGFAAPDEVVPLIGKYLKAARPRVRLAAIRVLRSVDPFQAVSSLFKLLETCTPDQRSLTMQCLVQFEFSLIRDRLANLLESGKAPEILEDALALFDANPDVGSLYLLFRLGRRLGGKHEQRIDQVRARVSELLIASGQLTPETLKTLENGFPQRLQLEDIRRAGPRPAYALAELEQEPERVWPVLRDTMRQMFREYGRHLLIALVVGLILAWAFGLRQVPVEVRARSGALIQSEVTRGEGMLLQVTDYGWKIRLTNGVIWHLSPPPGGFPFIIEGMKVVVEASLFRRTSEGVFQGRCVSFRISF